MPETSATPADNQQEAPPPAGPLRRLWRNWIKPIGLAILIVFGFRSTFYDWNDVPSASMEPTILVGDRVFVNRLAYDLKIPFTNLIFETPIRIATWGGPERGDVVVFFAPQDGRRMIKRVIGLPGDTIEVRDSLLYINGVHAEYKPVNQGKYERLDLDPPRGPNNAPMAPGYVAGTAEFQGEVVGDVLHPIMVLRRPSQLANWGPQEIPEAHYLMMGDNRNNSRDSRDPSLGFIPREYIVGKAFGTAFSTDRVPSFSVRWDRFFRGLDHTNP